MIAALPERKYRIERYLAEGGMGAIYLGKKLGAGGFEKEIVLKQLLPEFTARPEFRDLFFREAKISASLDHMNIVRTYDLVASDDALFIVMEYVPGADLRTISWRAKLRRKPLSVSAILHVALEILAGLSYAHARRGDDGQALGIIHRDVSPSNILCSGHGDVKLSDFGIAKAATFSSVFYRVRGKVGYMSPEQAHNEPLDSRSDLFSLAVCVFETLTGERLFTGDLHTPPEVVYAARLPSLSAKRPDIPFELEPVMERALHRRPEDRYQDAASLAEAIRTVARHHGLLSSAPALAAELHALLGPDPEAWTRDDQVMTQTTEKLPLLGGHLGRTASPVPLPAGAVPEALFAGGGSTLPLAAGLAALPGPMFPVSVEDPDLPVAVLPMADAMPSPTSPTPRRSTPPAPQPVVSSVARPTPRTLSSTRAAPPSGQFRIPAAAVRGKRNLGWVVVLGFVVGVVFAVIWSQTR